MNLMDGLVQFMIIDCDFNMVIQIEVYIHIIMSEGHLLKSSGRVTCQGQQMYYELLLNNTHYLIKFYDVLGKVRLIRPIKLPTKSVEIYGVGEYLFCYETVLGQGSNGSIYLVKLSDLKSTTQKYIFNLECDMQQQRKIEHIFCSLRDNLIIFSDIQRNIYTLRIKENDLVCKFVYKHNKQIQQLSLSQPEQVVIVNQDMGVVFLEIQWEQMKLIKQKEEPYLKGYYRGDEYIVHYSKYREWMSQGNALEEYVEEDNYFVHINKEGELTQFDEDANIDKYTREFAKDSDILITSGRNYVLLFNKTQSLIFSVYEQLQRITPVDDNLMADLKHNNFLVHFKRDQCHNILLEIRIFGSLVGQKWALHQYEISKDGSNPHQVFLKKNLHTIYQFNGLITPMYEKEVQKQLNNFYNLKQQYTNVRLFVSQSKESKLQKQSKVERQHLKKDITPYELGIELLKAALQHFPSSLYKLLRKLKGNVQFNKNISYIQQTHRFFQYCQYILQEQMDNIIRISESVQKQSQKSTCLKTKDKDQVEKAKNLLQSIASFVHTFINVIRIELDEDERHISSDFSKKQHEKLKYHYKVYDTARSLFIIVKMFEEENIVIKFEDEFKKLNEQRLKCIKSNKLNNLYYRLKYEPLFAHQHFSLIQLIFKHNKASFVNFIQFLLANSAHFVENAYFYQLITRLDSVPFLQTDVSEFIDNIINNVPLLRNESNMGEQSKINCKKSLYQMTGMALKLKLYPFTKYMIQLNIVYEQYALAIMLIFSDTFVIPQNYDETAKEHLFVIRSLIIAQRIDLAHLYVLNHYSPQLFGEFAKLAYINGNSLQMLELNQKKYILQGDQHKLKDLLHIDDKRWSILFEQKHQ